MLTTVLGQAADAGAPAEVEAVVVTTDQSPWWQDPDAWAEMAPMLTQWAVKVVGVLVILVIAYLLAGWVRRAVMKSLGRAKFDTTLSKFFAQLARWTVLIFALLFCLSLFGVNTTSAAAVIAAAGLAIGLAFQGTLSNFAAGVMLLTFRPFKVGDAVNVAGVLGIVNEIELFFTLVDTFDNRRIILPNSQVFGTTIENISHHSERRADVPVGVEYAADIDKTREVLTQAAASVEGKIEGVEGREPAILLMGLGDSAVNWEVRVWAPAADFFTVKQALTRAIKHELDAAGLGIPFPQMDVHLDAPAPQNTGG